MNLFFFFFLIDAAEQGMRARQEVEKQPKTKKKEERIPGVLPRCGTQHCRYSAVLKPWKQTAVHLLILPPGKHRACELSRCFPRPPHGGGGGGGGVW